MYTCPKCNNTETKKFHICPKCGHTINEELNSENVTNNELENNNSEPFSDNELKDNNSETTAQDAIDELFTAGPANYVKKADKYKDLQGSAISLIVAGILGDCYIIGNILGFFGNGFNGISSILFYIVMGSLFNVFLISGIMSLRKAKKVKSEISLEENTTETIINQILYYGKDNIDKKILNDNNLNTIADLDDAEVYYKRTGYIKECIISNYGQLDEIYLEDLIEQIYTKMFESGEN